MRYFFSSISTLFIVFGMYFPSQAADWRGIEPLKSTRSQVEQILGVKGEEAAGIVVYNTEAEKVFVEYSLGKCNESAESEWDINKEVVISIKIYPKNSIFIRDLGIDLIGFEKTLISADLPNMFRYTDTKTGISVTIDANSPDGGDAVASFGFYPTSDQRSLKCPKESPRQAECSFVIIETRKKQRRSGN